MTNSNVSRRTLLSGFAAATFSAAPVMANAAGFLRGSGEVRRLHMYNGRAGETLNTIYWIEGEYVQPALEEINYFMRDLHNNQTRGIDVRMIDILNATHNLMETSEPYLLLSGYRSPETNARSSGAARNSLHMQGEAADIRLSSRTVSQIARAASAVAAGGVGRYSRLHFVHMDCGTVRTWRG